MAKPINHDFASGTVTTAWGAAKGGLLGMLISAVVVGALVAGTVALLGTAGIAIGGALGLGGGTALGAGMSMFAGTGGTITAIAGGLGALFGMVTSTIPAAIFGALGAASGAHKVHAEKAAFMNKAQNYARRQDASQNNAAMIAMQQGYLMGQQEGRQIGQQEGQEYVVNQLRQHMQNEMMKQGLEAHGGHAAKVGSCAPCASKVEALAQQREAEAATVKTV